MKISKICLWLITAVMLLSVLCSCKPKRIKTKIITNESDALQTPPTTKKSIGDSTALPNASQDPLGESTETPETNIKIITELEDKSMFISSPYCDFSVYYNTIEEYMYTPWDYEKDELIDGTNGKNLVYGAFKGEDYEYTMFAYKNGGNVILLYFKNQYLVFNLETPEETYAFYESLKAKIDSVKNYG